MELLVVIAILALLIALLLPTIHRVRRQAAAVACQSTLRQWGMLMATYAAANDGKFFSQMTLVERRTSPQAAEVWVYYGTMDDPPPYQDEVSISRYSGNVCMDRHTGGINVVFMDWSVRKVGLKQLWALKWHKEYDMANRWTPAGGVRPEHWPAWMRAFKD